MCGTMGGEGGSKGGEKNVRMQMSGESVICPIEPLLFRT